MKYRVFFDQETKRHRRRFLDVVCQSINDISEAILYDRAVGLQIHEVFSANFDDIINKAISRDLDVPIGEFSRGKDRVLYRLLYESVYKNLDSFISQLQVSVCSIKEINLLEVVHKGDLDDPEEKVIDAITTIQDVIYDRCFSILCCKDIKISKEQQEQIIQILKRRLVEKLDLLEYTISWNDNFLKAKLDCISNYIIKSNWHFGLKREDGTVYSDVSLWPKPEIKGEEVIWSLGYKRFKPVIWFGLDDKEQLDCWSIYGTEEENEDNNSVWFPLRNDRSRQVRYSWFSKDECERISKMDVCFPELDYEIFESCPIVLSSNDKAEDLARKVNSFLLEQYNYAQTIEMLGVKEEDISPEYYGRREDFHKLKIELCKAFITYCMTHNSPKIIEFVKRLLVNLDSFEREKGVEGTFSFTIMGQMGDVSFYMDNREVRISSSGLSDYYSEWNQIFYADGETESDYGSFYSYDFDVFGYLNNKYDNVVLHIEEPAEFKGMEKES